MQTQQYNYREKKMKYICNVKDKHMFHFFFAACCRWVCSNFDEMFLHCYVTFDFNCVDNCI